MVQWISGSRGPLKFLWSVLSLLVVLSFALTACGGESTPSSSMQSNTTNQSSASGTTFTVTITEKTGGHDIYSFDPATINAKVGDTIQWVNNSDENHLLTSDTAGLFSNQSIVPRSSGSNTNNTYQVKLGTAGTYTYSSKLVQRMNNESEMDSSAKGTIIVS